MMLPWRVLAIIIKIEMSACCPSPRDLILLSYCACVCLYIYALSRPLPVTPSTYSYSAQYHTLNGSALEANHSIIAFVCIPQDHSTTMKIIINYQILSIFRS